MIIVSQDKSVIVNFKNVEAIEIGNVEENQCKGTIYARLVSAYFYKIGEYKTEERAKEVLQDIVTVKEFRNAGDYMRITNGSIECGNDFTNTFYMPEE